MNELVKQADELIQKIHRLLDRNDKLSADLLEKEEKVRELSQHVKLQTERNKQLEEEMASLKLAENLHLPATDMKETKKKINEYLRE
jgi:hypothetical protein